MPTNLHRPSRRDWLRWHALGAVGFSASGWLRALAADTAAHPHRKRACILLWMSGGPSQMDTFDLKPGHANGGPFKAIKTAAPGVEISEHLPKVAAFAKHLAVVRSMTSKEGEHNRAAFLLRTGYLPQEPIQYPSIGSLLSKELGDLDAELPNFVSVVPRQVVSEAVLGPGFLGPRYAPLVLGNSSDAPATDLDAALKVPDIQPPVGVSKGRADARLDLLHRAEKEYAAGHPGTATHSRQSAYARALRLMHGKAARAFDLKEEPAKVRDAYGRNFFGQGCLLARRLIEHGVPFVEVTHMGDSPVGWDTHGDNFTAVRRLSGILDPAWAALMGDLKERGLLDSTLIVWAGEFGRTPKINPQTGRDHHALSFSAVLAGGGIKGGQVVGKTSADGMEVKDRPVTPPDFLATVCKALGVDPTKPNDSNVGRPIRIVEKSAEPIREVLA